MTTTENTEAHGKEENVELLRQTAMSGTDGNGQYSSSPLLLTSVKFRVFRGEQSGLIKDTTALWYEMPRAESSSSNAGYGMSLFWEVSTASVANS